MKISTIQTMGLDAGNASLDLVNSGYGMVPGEIVERLHSYTDFLTLACRHGIIHQQTSITLQDEANRNPELAANALNEVKYVRKVLYTIFSTLANRGKIDQEVLATFNQYLADTLAHRKISISGVKLFRDWSVQDGDLSQVLRHYVLSAYEILTGSKNIFIKQCGRCTWLFLDESKNHRRKWCDMKVCGSSDKAKRYYIKRKQLGQQ